MAKRTMYLSQWVNFGIYRKRPTNLKKIIDTVEGRKWFRRFMEKSYDFEFDKTVIEYLKQKEEEHERSLLQPVGGQ